MIFVKEGRQCSKRSMVALQAKVSAKAPYNQYSALAGEGVTIAWGNPADTAALPSGSFDVVYDNNGKDMAACQPAIDHFKVRTSCSHGMPCLAWRTGATQS